MFNPSITSPEGRERPLNNLGGVAPPKYFAGGFASNWLLDAFGLKLALTNLHSFTPVFMAILIVHD